MAWEKWIQSEIQAHEFETQNDWDAFYKKLQRHHFVKRLRQVSFVTVTSILILGMIGVLVFHNSTKTKSPLYVNNEQTNPKKVTETNIKANKSPETNNVKTSKPNANKTNYFTSNKKDNNAVTKPVLSNIAENIQDSNGQKENTVIPVTKTQAIIQKVPSSEFYVDKNQGCGTLIVHFTPQEINDSVIYLWEFGDDNFSNEKTPSHQYRVGIYTVSLTTKHFRSGKLNQKVKKDFIMVFAEPKADFSCKVVADNEVQINNLSTGFEQCQWIVDGFVFSSDFSPHFSLENGSHEISLLLNNHGCMDTIIKTVNVLPEIKMYLPTAFTPNGDRQNDVFKPVFNHLPDSYKILIFDQWGKIVFSSTDANNSWDGKIKGQPPKQGLYLWKIVYQQKNNKPVEKSGQVKLIIK